MIEVGVGIDVVRGKRGGAAENQLIGAAVIVRGPLVAVEALRNRAMADHARTRDAVFARLGDNRRHSAGVVQMSMRIDDRVDAGRGVSAHQGQRLVLIQVTAGVDQHQAFVGLADREIAEPSAKGHLGRDLFDLTGGGERMLVAGRELAAPQAFSRLFDSGHRRTHLRGEGKFGARDGPDQRCGNWWMPRILTCSTHE